PTRAERVRDWCGRHRRIVIAAAALLLLVGGLGGYFLLRPTPIPDFETAGMDDVFNYTLLEDDFNKLPIDRRLSLIGDLIKRLKSMTATDSAMMAAFAAGIRDKAREQLMENASKLAIDVWDSYAKDYGDVPADEREQYLDDSYVEFTKMMETLAGETRDISDEERLDEARQQAARDKKAIQSGEGPSGEQFGRMFGFMREDVAKHAAPQQRSRGQLMMRDMSRRFRGESVSGGG
ncbi:MAG: hypothetical protein H7Y88_06635, partial [Phycisphaerales bacterium]|nr:hypothetical protein [Phycisphaerales bacterium]